jgi:hypothetical protein
MDVASGDEVAILRLMRLSPLLISLSLLAGCSGGNGADVNERDIVGTYVGTASGSRPIQMQLLADHSFSGDLQSEKGYAQHTGTWRLGAADISQQCRQVEFLDGPTLIGRSCFAVGADQVTGMDCAVRQSGEIACAMQRKLNIKVPVHFGAGNAAQ